MKLIKELIVFVLMTFAAFTQSLWWPKGVCYERYGCFNKSSLWLPQKPSQVGTKFNLFTRLNRETPQIIDDHNTNELRASNFRISRNRTIFIIHGYTESIDTWARPMKEALLAQEDCNVILVDWSKGAKSLLYPQAAGNTQLVGSQIAVLIRFLISSNKGTSSWANRFYIVGFSLGAQTAGFAGSNLRRLGMRLGRITGLDPASVLFSKANVNYRLDPGDAQYVDVIHTDAGGLGSSTKMGHIDFYPNGGSRQPGCPVVTINIASLACDHMRAPEYYTASVKKLCSWTAYPCLDYNNAKCLNCNGKCPSMGYDADRTARRGLFYLKTNRNAPFCALWWRKRVCYERYGCFYKPSLWLPQKPSQVGTKFHLFTRLNRETAQIIDDHNTNALRASNFRISRNRTIFIVHGYTESIDTWARPMKEALLAQEDCNVVLVDWSKGARKLLYPQAAGNTQLVGSQIAVLIRFLISSNNGTSSWANRFYIVGFSLGAQTAGFAGSNLRSHGMRLGRITGLDPASVLFSKANVKYRLDPGDAQYVDVIHTDAGGLGSSTKMGHIDFYPNGGSRQPGCPILTGNIPSVACDHMRAPEYYTASVKKLCSWTAYPCLDYNNAKCLNCNGKCPSMGYDADRTARRGLFYLKTNRNAPFCGKM